MMNPIPRSGFFATRPLEDIQADIDGLPSKEKALVYSYVMATLNACHALVEEALAQDELCSSQEPVLWGVMTSNGKVSVYAHGSKKDAEQIAAASHFGTVAAPLYTTSPKEQQSCDKRPWVSLTAADRWKIIYATEQDERVTVMQLVEAKLKELNT